MSDIFVLILEYLDYKDILNVILVCKEWNQLLKNYTSKSAFKINNPYAYEKLYRLLINGGDTNININSILLEKLIYRISKLDFKIKCRANIINFIWRNKLLNEKILLKFYRNTRVALNHYLKMKKKDECVAQWIATFVPTQDLHECIKYGCICKNIALRELQIREGQITDVEIPHQTIHNYFSSLNKDGNYKWKLEEYCDSCKLKVISKDINYYHSER